MNYLSAGGRDIALKSERVAIEHLLRGRNVLATLPTYDLYRVSLGEERDDENFIRDKLLLFYSLRKPSRDSFECDI